MTASPKRPNRAPLWLWALAATVLMQTLCAFLTRVYPVMGPALTDSARIAPEAIGYLASLSSLGTLWYLVSGGDLLAKLGPLRSMQFGAVVGVLGLLVSLTGEFPVLMLASFMIGYGYGPTATAGSEVLSRYAPVQHRSLVFSIKQSGVPLGGVLAGLIVPAALAAAGWRVASVACALVTLAVTVVVEPLHRSIDAEARRGLPLRPSRLVDPRTLRTPFKSLAGSRALQLVTMASVAFAIVQGSLLAFFVTYLTVELGTGLVAAGFAFSIMQLTGVAGRIAAGWVADRIGSRPAVLAVLAGGSSLAMLGVVLLTPSSSAWMVPALAGVIGVASTSWNGVFMAEVSQLAPPGKVADVAAGATFFTFIGYVLGPAAFGALIALGGSYRAAFALLALAPLCGVVALARASRR